MTKLGHQATGILSAIILVSIYPKFPIPAAFACCFGATAPDWLEIAWTDKESNERKSLIPHRTITHWLVLWVILLLVGIYFNGLFFGALALGFAVGGLTHLMFDVPNPMGIPVLNPFKNTSMKLWNSGQHEWLVVSGYAVFAFSVFFISRHF